MHLPRIIVTLGSTVLLSLFAGDGATGQNLTSAEPDIVFECINASTQKIDVACDFICFNVERTIPSSPPGVTVPYPFSLKFVRLEFFSKPGRTSENWLVAIKGRNQGAAADNPVFISFATIGNPNICRIVPGLTGHEVKLQKYY